MDPNFKVNFRKRIYAWTLDLLRFIDQLPKNTTDSVIAKQLMRSGTSVVANYIEAQSGSSRRDFVNFLNHALKSANESLLWLSMLKDSGKSDARDTERLMGELDQIAKILGSSIITIKRKDS